MLCIALSVVGGVRHLPWVGSWVLLRHVLTMWHLSWVALGTRHWAGSVHMSRVPLLLHVWVLVLGMLRIASMVWRGHAWVAVPGRQLQRPQSAAGAPSPGCYVSRVTSTGRIWRGARHVRHQSVKHAE